MDIQDFINMTQISDYLDQRLILFLSAKSRDDALEQMVDHIQKVGKIQDKEEFLNAIVEREKIVSTGIGMGVAIPHAKLPTYNDFFIAVGILEQGVDWNSLDGADVRIIFMIGGPDDKQTEYLQILSNITLAIKDEQRRKQLLSKKSPEEIVQLFEDF